MGTTEDEMAELLHKRDGHEFERTLGVGESHEIVKQTDSGLGVGARESLGSP